MNFEFEKDIVKTHLCFCTGQCRLPGGYCPSNPFDWNERFRGIRPVKQKGWVCPTCHRVNAPHVNTCPCYNERYSTYWNREWTSTSTGPR